MSLKVTGLEPLIGTLKEGVTLDDVRKIVKDRGKQLANTMVRQTEIAYVKGYSLGDTAGSINLKITNRALTAEVQASTDYVEYVEKGTRYMSPEPILQPSLDKVGTLFLKDMSRIMK